VRLDGATEYVVADIPGLIEGASEGKGLGHQFLRHVERARVLCVLVDLAWEGAGTAEPAEQVRVLLAELGRYQPELLDRPRLIIGSRADIGSTDTPGVDLDLVVSGVTGDGLRSLTGQLADLVKGVRAEEPKDDGFVVHRPFAEGFRVEAIDAEDGGGWRVVGRQAERAVALSDINNPDALAYAQGRMKSLGVDRALVRAGVRSGDTVHIGTFSFDYEPDEAVFTGHAPKQRRR
jgi:GTP-binding protein